MSHGIVANDVWDEEERKVNLAMGGEDALRILDLWDGMSYMTDLPDPGWFYHHDGKEVFTGDLLTLESVDNNVGDMWWEGFRLRLHDPGLPRRRH